MEYILFYLCIYLFCKNIKLTCFYHYRLLAATVFRPNGARRAFPCFDEPHVRAPFRISVFRDRFHIGLSNSIVHTTEDVGFYMGTGLVNTKIDRLSLKIYSCDFPTAPR